MKTRLLLLLIAMYQTAFSQVAINNDASQPDPSAMLDVKSTKHGLLAPRMTQEERDGILNPATGLLIYQTDKVPGYYYNSGTPASPAWQPVWDLALPYSRTININEVGFTIYNSNSVNGRAIMGIANGASGTTVGIWGASASPSGVGIQGRNMAVSGSAYGMRGESFSPAGAGVYGHNYATTGQAAGVVGLTASSMGTGVYGVNPASTGAGYGVYGASSSPNGIGVFGSGGIWGVWGRTDVPAGNGVVGSALSASTNGAGVYGYSTSATGIGVLGRNLLTTGTNYGVRGEAYSDNGEGVVGHATSATGPTRGIHGMVNSPDGYAGYFEGGKVYVAGNLGIGAMAPDAKLDVVGSVKIADGTQGAGKVLTSDAGGLASWQAPAAIPVPGGGTGQIQFNNAGVFAGDVNLVWDAVSHRQGIGATPLYPLHVYSNTVRTIYAENIGVGGAAIFGFANAAAGLNAGVRGQTSSTAGAGVYADATSLTGTNYGIRALVASPDGYSGYFTGGRFFVGGNVGIAVTAPAYPLHVFGTLSNGTAFIENNTSSGKAVVAYASATSGANTGLYGYSASTGGTGVYGSAVASSGVTFGVKGSVSSADGYSGSFTGGKFYVQQNAGFGTTTPNATLDVNGTVQIGLSGKIFSEIYELTGTTAATGDRTFLSYPTGYTLTNTRVLSCEINFDGNSWVGMGGCASPISDVEKLFYFLGNQISIYYPAKTSFQNRAFRMLLMKVQ